MFWFLLIGQICVLLKVLPNAAISYDISFLRECGVMMFRGDLEMQVGVLGCHPCWRAGGECVTIDN